MTADPAVPAGVEAAFAVETSPVCAYVYDLATLRGERGGPARRVTGRHGRALRREGERPPGRDPHARHRARRLGGRVRRRTGPRPGRASSRAGQVRAVERVRGSAGSEGSGGSGEPGPPGRLAFGGPAKTDAELEGAVRAIRAGVDLTVNVESEGELRRLALVAGDARVPVALRVNRADATLGRSHRMSGSHRMTGGPTPFGIDEARLGAVIALARTLPRIDVVGFHLHAVSNNLDASAHAAFIGDALDWSRRTAVRSGIDLRTVNVGGGLGIDYDGDREFDLDTFRRAMPAVPDGVTLMLEPGRFLARAPGGTAPR